MQKCVTLHEFLRLILEFKKMNHEIIQEHNKTIAFVCAQLFQAVVTLVFVSVASITPVSVIPVHKYGMSKQKEVYF